MSFQVDLTHSPVLWVVSFLLLGLTLLWTVRHVRDPFFPPPVRILILVLRWTAVLLLVFLLSDLRTSVQKRQLRKPSVAFAWDLSASMPAGDEEGYEPRDILGSGAWRDLRRRVNVEHITDMRDPRVISEQRLRSLPADERISDCSRLLRYAEERQKYRQTVLVSDGQSYLGEALEDFRAEGMIIHALGAGDTEGQGLPVLEAVHLPAYVDRRDSLRISWVLKNPSLEALRGQIIIRDPKGVLLEREIRIGAQRMRPFEDVFPPAEAGLRELEWRFSADSSETGIGSRSIRVHDARVRVLCDAEPADRDIAMVSTLLKSRGDYEIYRREEWERQFSGEKPDILVQTWHPVRRPAYFPGVPAILFYRDGGDGYASVTELRINIQRPYVLFVPDPAGNAWYWRQLSPVLVPEFNAEGRVIMESASGRPVIIEQMRPGRMIVNAAGIWRWRLAGYRKEWNGIYRHLVEGMVETLLRRGDKGFISLDREHVYGMRNAPVDIGVQLQNRGLLDATSSSVSITLYDSAFSVLRREDRGIAARIMETMTLSDTGNYYITAALYSGGERMESDTALLHVAENDLETVLRGCNVSALRSLSGRHEGKYMHLRNADSLLSAIRPEREWQRVTRVFNARNAAGVYILLFLAFFGDWVLRKRFGGT